MSRLFEPIKIGNMIVPNRFVRSATCEYLSKDGYFNEKFTRLYQSLCEGGVGMLITGYFYAHPSGKSSTNQAAIYDDRFIPAIKKTIFALKNYNTRIIAQIAHGGRQTTPELCKCKPIAPSAVTDKKSGITPREMKEKDIESCIEWFIKAGIRTKEAGFAGVQLHVAHGYLLSEFLSPYTNRRNDKWGGSIENRARIVILIIEGLKKIFGNDFPILAKINANDGIEGGIAVEDVIKAINLFEKAGLCAVEISGGMHEAGSFTVRTRILKPSKEGYLLPLISRISEEVSIPIIAVGGIRSLDVMDRALSNGYCNLISLSRPFIREPDLVKKLKTGKLKADCVSCNGCFNPEGIICAQLEKRANAG